MSRVNANGYFDAMSADDRYQLRILCLSSTFRILAYVDEIHSAVLLAEHKLICKEDLELGNTRTYYYPLSLKPNKDEEKKLDNINAFLHLQIWHKYRSYK